jgi:ribosomal protein S18 acetylase RimI-like enzyme
MAVDVETRTRVRPMRLHEIEALAAAIPETSASQLANRWREQGLGYREVMVAERDGELAGTVSIGESYRPVRGLHLFALEVAESKRNQGIGADVVRWVVEEARRRELRRVFLEVRTDNPARRLYHRLGFRRIGGVFENAWWRFEDDGTQERVVEDSVRMVKRVSG